MGRACATSRTLRRRVSLFSSDLTATVLTRVTICNVAHAAKKQVHHWRARKTNLLLAAILKAAILCDCLHAAGIG